MFCAGLVNRARLRFGMAPTPVGPVTHSPPREEASARPDRCRGLNFRTHGLQGDGLAARPVESVPGRSQTTKQFALKRASPMRGYPEPGA